MEGSVHGGSSRRPRQVENRRGPRSDSRYAGARAWILGPHLPTKDHRRVRFHHHRARNWKFAARCHALIYIALRSSSRKKRAPLCRASPLIRRKPSSAMECKRGNGDRVISPQRETREVGLRPNHNIESLVPLRSRIDRGTGRQFAVLAAISLTSKTAWRMAQSAANQSLCQIP
jgi:hypothetical protein